MTPLAEQLRPTNLSEYVGQEHLIGAGRPIRNMVSSGRLSSMILWGPPGSGKTTLAKILGQEIDANFHSLSAISAKKSDIQLIAKEAKNILNFNKQTIVFIDEIHRFNKAQQDALLPYVEDGTFVLIGATTENPGFEVNAPLISRAQVFVLEKLSAENLTEVIKKAEKILPKLKLKKEIREFLINFSDGDARKLINSIEAISTSGNLNPKLDELKEILQNKFINFDKKGDEHFDTVSAFIKSMRGSEPDATLHYLARMLKGGEDPMFIARRMVVFASEDIGNANPNCLLLATSCMQAVHMIGMPEAQLILAQTATYLATSKKSIASTEGISKALADVENKTLDPIPLHLRNPKNKLAEEMNYGKGHVRYPWLEEKRTGKKINQEYLPKNLIGAKYYVKDWE